MKLTNTIQHLTGGVIFAFACLILLVNLNVSARVPMGNNLGDIMIVTKRWFVIYDANGIIHLHGDNTGQRTETSLNLKEFDTKAKMLKYIQDNNLELQNENI